MNKKIVGNHAEHSLSSDNVSVLRRESASLSDFGLTGNQLGILLRCVFAHSV